MPVSRRVLLGVVLVALTLTPRMLAASRLTVTSFDDHSLRDAALARFMARSGVTILGPRGTRDVPMLKVQRGSCMGLVANMAPQGVHEALMLQTAKSSHYQYSVEFQGRRYDRQPRWASYGYDFWRKTVGLFGARVHVASVTAVLMPQGCRLDDLPWRTIDDW